MPKRRLRVRIQGTGASSHGVCSSVRGPHRPHSIFPQDKREKVQRKAARFVTGNYTYETRSMTGILEQLMWESLKKRKKDTRGRLIKLYKSLKGAVEYPPMTLLPQTGVQIS